MSETGVEWVVTTRTAPWRRGEVGTSADAGPPDVLVHTHRPRQTIEGFGACFNELGWTSLAALAPEARDGIMLELFSPGVGANFALCRMPVGANDFSRDWYSYDEVAGDFRLEHFSIANDLDTLVPFIRSALSYRPDLRLWASPWSPRTWMKTNGHYAAALPTPWQQGVRNGLRPDQVGAEGTDMFIQEEPYLRAYAAYIGRFVDEYRTLGIPHRDGDAAERVQLPTGLSQLHLDPGRAGAVHPVPGPGDGPAGRGRLRRDAGAAGRGARRRQPARPGGQQVPHGRGVPVGREGTIADVHRAHPGLALYQTEQECGDGRNDWRFCRYTWSLLEHYLTSGAGAYLYWNIALEKGGVSRWGWAQNSLVTVDLAAGTFVYNHEYHLMKHLSHFVEPGARLLETASYAWYESQLAFANPDGSVVVVMQNDTCDEQPVRVRVGDQVIAPTLPANSFKTFALRLPGSPRS